MVLVLRAARRRRPKSQWAPFYSSRYEASAAKEFGAKALLLVSTDEKGDVLPAMKRGAAAGSAQIPVVSLKLSFLKKLLEVEEIPISEGSGLKELKPFAVKKMSATMNIKLKREKASASNIVGFLPATVKTADTIVVGAHWDHLGRGIEGSLAGKFGEIHRGLTTTPPERRASWNWRGSSLSKRAGKRTCCSSASREKRSAPSVPATS